MSKIILIALGIVIVVSIAQLNIYLITKKEVTKPTTIQAQKFRFGEQCSDGLRVEYVSTIRLPKSVICQKEVGE